MPRTIGVSINRPAFFTLACLLGFLSNACNAPLCANDGECLEEPGVVKVCIKPLDAKPEDKTGICGVSRCGDKTWNTCAQDEDCLDTGKPSPRCFPAQTLADPCAENNGDCGDPAQFTCVRQTTRVQCVAVGSVPCKADDGDICTSDEYCADTNPRTCFKRIAIGFGDCTRTRMCVVGAVCNTTSKRCEGSNACTKDADCGAQPGSATFCDDASKTCAPKRKAGEICPRAMGAEFMCKTNICNASNGKCGCNVSADCTLTAGLTSCDLATRTCVAPSGCMSDAQCNATEFCNATGKCEGKHPYGGSCNRATSPSGMCLTNQCNPNQTCGCTANAQCTAVGFKCDTMGGSPTVNVCIPDTSVETPAVRFTIEIVSTGTGSKIAPEFYVRPWNNATRPYRVTPFIDYVARGDFKGLGEGSIYVDLPAYVVYPRSTPAISKKATVGPGGPLAPGFMVGQTYTGLEMQVLMYASTASPNTYYSDVTTVTMEKLVRVYVEGINGNPLPKTQIDLTKSLYVSHMYTGETGNLLIRNSTFGYTD